MVAESLVLKRLTAVKVCDGTPDAAREPAPRNFSKTASTGFAKDNDVRMTSKVQRGWHAREGSG